MLTPSRANPKSADDEGGKILAPKLFFANKHKPYIEFKLEVALPYWEDFTLTKSYFVIKGTFLCHGGLWPCKETHLSAEEGERPAYSVAWRQLLTRIPNSCPFPTVLLHSKLNCQRLERRRKDSRREGASLTMPAVLPAFSFLNPAAQRGSD